MNISNVKRDKIVYINLMILSLFITIPGFGKLVITKGQTGFSLYQIELVCFAVIMIIANRLNYGKLGEVSTFISAYCLFILSAIISIYNVDDYMMFLKYFYLLIMYGLILCVYVGLLTDPYCFKMVLRGILIGGYVNVIYGFLQAFFPFTFGTGYRGLDTISIDENSIISSYLNYYRPKAFFAEGNEFGQYLIFIMPFLMCNIYSQKYKKSSIVLYLFSVIMLMINNTRGSLIAILFGTLLFFWTVKVPNKRKALIKITTIIAIIAISTISSMEILKIIPTRDTTRSPLDNIIQRIELIGTEQDATFWGRIENMYLVLEKGFLYNPLTGVGLGNLYKLLEDTHLDTELGLITNPVATSGNLIADILGETGILGGISLIIMLVYLIRIGYRNFRTSCKLEEIDILSKGSYIAIICLLINSISVAPFYLAFYWLNLSLILSIKNYYRKNHNLIK